LFSILEKDVPVKPFSMRAARLKRKFFGGYMMSASSQTRGVNSVWKTLAIVLLIFLVGQTIVNQITNGVALARSIFKGGGSLIREAAATNDSMDKPCQPIQFQDCHQLPVSNCEEIWIVETSGCAR
jgi:hypothetical protein